MKIVIFASSSDFTKEQNETLLTLGEIIFTGSSEELSESELLSVTSGAEILAADPDNFGGFEKAQLGIFTKVMNNLPNLKGVALSTTSFGWIDLDYCKKRDISVSNIPGYSSESVAEHALALLLCLAKRIIITDRRTQKDVNKMEKGFELRGKTLGVIGLGNIGSKVADLGLGIGMKVIAFNRSPKTKEGVEMKSFEEVLKESDAISLNTTHEEKNRRIIGKEEIAKMKDGVIIVNTVDRDLVDEEAMAEALKSGKVYGYAYEGVDLINTPLAKIENAIGLKGFGWYTKESISNLYRIWVENIVAFAKGNPINVVNK